MKTYNIFFFISAGFYLRLRWPFYFFANWERNRGGGAIPYSKKRKRAKIAPQAKLFKVKALEINVRNLH